MSLFVSNSTIQHLVFNYREPKANLLAHLEISKGCQAEIGKEWSSQQKQKVVDQLERFGARNASEVHGKMEGFLGLLYRDSDRIEESEIILGHDAVMDTQEHRSATQTTRAALGFDLNINGGKRGRRAARMTEVTVEQQLAPHEKRSGNEVTFIVGVDPEGRTDAKLPT